MVKDNPKRSYFIRVTDMDRKLVVFDQEIYNQFRYRSPRPYFHTFEAEDGQVSNSSEKKTRLKRLSVLAAGQACLNEVRKMLSSTKS